MTAKIIEWLGLSYQKAIEREDFVSLLGSLESHQLEDMETEYHLTSFDNGIIVVLSLDKIVTGVQIFSGIDSQEDEEENFQKYPASIPFGLNLTMARDEVWEFLGKPDQSGEPTTIPILGLCSAWDLYQKDNLELSLHYDRNREKIESICIDFIEE